MTSVPGFLAKTFEIFSNPKYSDWCGWGQNGDTIVIRKIEPFSKNVLPNYFKHSNFQSFVRQLNMYDFHKTVQDPSHGEFQHTHFRKDRPDLLVHIKRKAHNKNHSDTGSMESSLSGAGHIPGTISSDGSGTKKSKLDKKRLAMLGNIEGLPPPSTLSSARSTIGTATGPSSSSSGAAGATTTGPSHSLLTTATGATSIGDGGGRTGGEAQQQSQQPLPSEMMMTTIEDNDLNDLFGPHGSLGNNMNNISMNGGSTAPLPLSMPVSLPPILPTATSSYLPPPPSFQQQQQQQQQPQQQGRKSKSSKSSKASAVTAAATQPPPSTSHPHTQQLSLYPEPGHMFDGGSVLEELVHQQTLHEHFERRLNELERQSLRVSGENALLKRVLVEYGSRQTETQQRVDKLIQLIYNVLMTNNALPPALTQSVNMLLQDAQNLYQYTSQPVAVPQQQQQQLALKEGMSSGGGDTGTTSAAGGAMQLSLKIPSDIHQQQQPSYRYNSSDGTSGGGGELEHQNSFTLFDTSAFSPVDYNHLSSGNNNMGLSPRMSNLLQLLPSSHNNNIISINSFDHVATSIGHSHDWNNNKSSAAVSAAHSAAPSLASLAYASAAVAHTDAEEREAAATLQRMTTPDYETMAALSSAAAATSNSSHTMSLLGSSSLSSSLLLPLPPTSSSYSSGGGELRRMASITGSYLDDHSLALSRGDSMETWTMYPPALSSASGAVLSMPTTSSAVQLQRQQSIKRERYDQQQQQQSFDNSNSGRPPISSSSSGGGGGGNMSNKLRKKDSMSSATTSATTGVTTSAVVDSNQQQLVQRLHSQQQATATRIDSLEMTLGALLQQVAEEVYVHPQGSSSVSSQQQQQTTPSHQTVDTATDNTATITTTNSGDDSNSSNANINHGVVEIKQQQQQQQHQSQPQSVQEEQDGEQNKTSDEPKMTDQ